MTQTRIAPANLPIPATREAAVDGAVADAGRLGALIVCFPSASSPAIAGPE